MIVGNNSKSKCVMTKHARRCRNGVYQAVVFIDRQCLVRETGKAYTRIKIEKPRVWPMALETLRH
jgi:hypothetical protein